MASTPQQSPKVEPKSLAEFLENSPPDAQENISDLAYQSGSSWIMQAPELQLHCDSERCNGIRVFHQTSGSVYLDLGNWSLKYVTYSCRNCSERRRIYAIAAKASHDGSGLAQKLGEIPPFGPPTPARVISLIGPERELFLRGRRAENHGLGIGAYAYYRRVVENQKGRIIGEMGRVAERLGAEKTVLELFARAAKETQFSTAIDLVKDAIPKSLLVERRNPLTLLHTALSAGLHELSDEECLTLATGIRLILTELAERMSQALKDDAELKQAVSMLLNRKTPEKK